MISISKVVIITPNDTKIVHEYKLTRETLLKRAFYEFYGLEEPNCSARLIVNGRPFALWKDQPVEIDEELGKDTVIKVEVVNNSANSCVMRINYALR